MHGVDFLPCGLGMVAGNNARAALGVGKELEQVEVELGGFIIGTALNDVREKEPTE